MSLIVLPINLFWVPFLGSLAFVCCPWSFPFDLGKGLWPKGGLLPIFLHPVTCHSGMRWQRELLAYLNGYQGLQASSSTCPTAPFLPLSQFSKPSCGFSAPSGVITLL